MQTGITRKVASILQKSLDGEVRIGAVYIHPFNAVTVKDVAIIDRHPFTGSIFPPADTLASIGSLTATLSLKTLLKKHCLHLDRVSAEDVLFHLTSEPDTTYGTNLTRILQLGYSEGGEMSADTLLTVNNLHVRNGRFRLQSMYPGVQHSERGIEYTDMDIVFDLDGHAISFSDLRCKAVVDRLDLREKSGYEVYGASGSCAVGRGKTIIDRFRFTDSDGSRMCFNKAILSYENSSSWGDFLRAVDLDITLGPSHLVLSSISNYSYGTFHDIPAVADIQEGRMKGPVSDFRVENLVFTNPYGISAAASGSCRGIPRMGTADLSADIHGIQFTTGALDKLLADFGASTSLRRFAPGTVFTLTGTASGKLDDFVASTVINSPLGRVKAHAKSRNLTEREQDTVIAAEASASGFNLGRFLVNDSFGKCDLTAEARIRFGGGDFSVSDAEAEISRLVALGHEYRNVSLTGNMHNKSVDAAIVSNDPDASLSLNASVDLSHESGRVSGVFNDVDLAALGLDTRGGTSRVSCRIRGEQGIEKDSPMQAHISGLTLTNDEGCYRIGDIDAEARMSEGHVTLALNSECVDAKYDGTDNFAALVKYVKSITTEQTMPKYFAAGPDSKPATPLDASFSANIHDTKGLLAFLMPELSVARGTAVNLEIDSGGGVLGYIISPAMSYNSMSAENLDVAIDNNDDSLNCSVNADVFKFNDINFNNAGVSLTACDNHATLAANYEGVDLLDNGSELYLDAFFSRDEEGKTAVDLKTLTSMMHIKSGVWELEPSEIRFRNNALSVDGFRLASENQSISINGTVAKNQTDTLQVDFKEMDLSLLNDFLGSGFPALEGIISGNLDLLSPLPDDMGLWADLALTGVSIDGRKAGDFMLRGDWDDVTKRINMDLDGHKDGSRTISLGGWFSPRDKQIEAVTTLDGFGVDVAEAFVKDYVTGLGGSLSGSVKASGPLNAMSLYSEGLLLNKVKGRVTYTNVIYTLDGSATIDERGLTFNNIGVKDEYGGIGVMQGSLGFRELKNFNMDATLDMSRLKAIDIPTMGSGRLGYVYGDLAISGNSRISGPFNALHVDADISTAGSGNVNVPIPESATAQGSDLLVFTKPAADTLAVSSAEAAPPLPAAKFTAHARVSVHPDVVASVEIDKDSGHVLTAGGTGVVELDLNTAKSLFRLNGDYNINKGKYLFNIPGIVSKEFDIKDGSSIKFNGDVMESTLDIKAIHNVKTSLATLLADSTAVSTRRNVECGINISGKLRSPEPSFSIEVPDIDPNTQIAVRSVLDTEDKVQKQFVALLLFGTFVPEGGAGVVNGTNMIISNVGEIVSSQLNNILQKLDIPLDFGIGYQQDRVGTDIFDVAVSTQLFNNRVLVNGSVGNRRYSTSKSANGDVVGDLDIEIKLDRRGDLRFKLFSHSADELSSSLDFTQRNGAGISYQKEFYTIKDFFRQLFTPRKRRDQDEYHQAMHGKEMKTIFIGD